MTDLLKTALSLDSGDGGHAGREGDQPVAGTDKPEGRQGKLPKFHIQVLFEIFLNTFHQICLLIKTFKTWFTSINLIFFSIMFRGYISLDNKGLYKT